MTVDGLTKAASGFPLMRSPLRLATSDAITLSVISVRFVFEPICVLSQRRLRRIVSCPELCWPTSVHQRDEASSNVSSLP
ncbi:hypothetical protein D9M72_604380 [compost metagenome]